MLDVHHRRLKRSLLRSAVLPQTGASSARRRGHASTAPESVSGNVSRPHHREFGSIRSSSRLLYSVSTFMITGAARETHNRWRPGGAVSPVGRATRARRASTPQPMSRRRISQCIYVARRALCGRIRAKGLTSITSHGDRIRWRFVNRATRKPSSDQHPRDARRIRRVRTPRPTTEYRRASAYARRTDLCAVSHVEPAPFHRPVVPHRTFFCDPATTCRGPCGCDLCGRPWRVGGAAELAYRSGAARRT